LRVEATNKSCRSLVFPADFQGFDPIGYGTLRGEKKPRGINEATSEAGMQPQEIGSFTSQKNGGKIVCHERLVKLWLVKLLTQGLVVFW
jgi:hypothetical protein